MAITDYTDALDAGWIVFPLHPISHGACGCGDEECKAVGKHPKDKGWQNTGHYDDQQLEYLEDFEELFLGNQLLDNYGVLVNGLLVVDVDGRNGGFESAAKLQHIREQAAFIVQSGSHNGEHWYFKLPQDFDGKLSQSVSGYDGIDFKSSGFVVGAYSQHASGNRYETIKGAPSDTTDAPSELLELLKRKERDTFAIDSEPLEISELADVVKSIANNGLDYERWIRVGMGLHHATDGSEQGYNLWLDWSAQCDGHDDHDMPKKWVSFGKSADIVTQGTLIKWAQDEGYVSSVTFEDDTDWGEIEQEAPAKNTKHDMLKPPGFVGELTEWINSRSLYPRPRLAVAAALQLVSNSAGLTHIVAETRTTMNLITLCIAGSRTGKGSIKRCMDEAHAALGLSPATHGKFKSSQELVRNALFHQGIFYIYDEFGKQLEKISGAGKGGAHYLEDLLAELIAMYSEANGNHGVSGDVKREMVEIIERQIAAINKNINSGLNAVDKAEADKALEVAKVMKAQAERGIDKPYLSFFAMTEPTSFNNAIEKDPWLLMGGFLGRAIMFEELDNVPMKKPLDQIRHDELPAHLFMTLSAMVTAGSAGGSERVERHGDWQEIAWSDEARRFLGSIEMYWRDVALAEQDAGTGLESQALGAAELTIKVAGILGAQEKVISREHIEWAHELIKDITLDKIQRARSGDKISSSNSNERGSGVIDAIMRHVSRLENGDYTTAGKVRQAIGRNKVTLEQTEQAITHLVNIGKIKQTHTTAGNGRSVTRYTLK